MRAINRNLIRWLSASVIRHLKLRGDVDGLTVVQPVDYDLDSQSANCAVFMDKWHVSVGISGTEVTGSLDLLVRELESDNIYSLQTMAGIIASYLDCIDVSKLGSDPVVDTREVIGSVEVDAGGVVVEMLGAVGETSSVIRAKITCQLTGTITGV